MCNGEAMSRRKENGAERHNALGACPRMRDFLQGQGRRKF